MKIENVNKGIYYVYLRRTIWRLALSWPFLIGWRRSQEIDNHGASLCFAS